MKLTSEVRYSFMQSVQYLCDKKLHLNVCKSTNCTNCLTELKNRVFFPRKGSITNYLVYILIIYTYFFYLIEQIMQYMQYGCFKICEAIFRTAFILQTECNLKIN